MGIHPDGAREEDSGKAPCDRRTAQTAPVVQKARQPSRRRQLEALLRDDTDDKEIIKSDLRREFPRRTPRPFNKNSAR